MRRPATHQLVDRLAAGDAFVRLSSWRKIEVTGPDAVEWLDDLVTADLSDLGPGRARRSLLLSPTGRIRAEFTVALPGRSIVLLQDPSQQASVLDLLSPYVLSSDVGVEDRTGEIEVFAFPGRSEAPNMAGTAAVAPSCVGTGSELHCPAEEADRVQGALLPEFGEAGSDDLETWRIAAAITRVGVDSTPDDLPQEVGLDAVVAADKGCFLGQEAVAKVRNLGHPRRLLLSLAAEGLVAPGDPVVVAGRPAGEITSVAAGNGEAVLLARVRWDGRAGPFRTGSGIPLRRRSTH
jgi:folate-binding protein YgfZ